MQVRMCNNMGYIMQIAMFMVVMHRFFRHFHLMAMLSAIGMMFMVMPCIAMFVMMVTSVSMFMLMSNCDIMLMFIWQQDIKIVRINTTFINTFVDQFILSQVQLFHLRHQMIERYTCIDQSSQQHIAADTRKCFYIDCFHYITSYD